MDSLVWVVGATAIVLFAIAMFVWRPRQQP